LIRLFNDALFSHNIAENQIAIAAVGGYGRGELSPGSDLDLLILHKSVNEDRLTGFVNDLLFPLWDEKKSIDYSVRTRQQTLEAASEDIKVVLGLLEIRYLAGDQTLVTDVAVDAQANWQKNAKTHLPRLKNSIDERFARAGQLAYLLEPDLKEARGGLRDINALRALARLEDLKVPLERVAEAESVLGRVRDALHVTSGRDRDLLLFTEQDKVARLLDYSDADELMLAVAKSARTVEYVMDRALAKTKKPKKTIFRLGKTKAELARGVELIDGEINLSPTHEVSLDPGIGLRAAAIAAQHSFDLSLEACTRLSEEFSPLPIPWPRQAREDFVSLIGAGEHMVEIFEALDQEGLISRWIPEWDHLRFLPQRNVLHRHTVDRHMLETAIRAANLTRKVHRPDLLLFAALFHDVGKGFADKDHSDYGSELIVPLASRLGFDDSDQHTLALLVQHHLLLPSVATRRDLDDPQTISYVNSLIPDANTLELLHALSVADGEATGKGAWSNWKAGLVDDLVHRSLRAMAGAVPAPQLELSESQIRKAATGELVVEILPREEHFLVEIVAPDHTGLLSLVAAVLSLCRLDIRSARTRTINNSAVMSWLVALEPHAPIPTVEKIEALIRRSLNGEVDINRKIDERINNFRKYPGIPTPPPVVSAMSDAATNATVIEVRMHDKPGVLYNVSKTISRFGVDIRAAIVSTLGAEVFDTLYITDLQGSALSEEKATHLASQVQNYLLTI
jgi:[protein-PII] uridylyltransferase